MHSPVSLAKDAAVVAPATLAPQPSSSDDPAPGHLVPTPADSASLPRRLSDFDTITAALDYAARGVTGFNFYNARGVLNAVLPYRDLRDQAVADAGRLYAAGLKHGDRVALLAATGPDFPVLFFACLYGGLIPIPLPLPTAFGRRDGYIDQIRGQLASSGARAVFAPSEYIAIIREAAGEAPHVITSARADLASLPEAKNSIHPGGADDLCYIQYSSGSTRFPTGVCVTHANLMANGRGMNRDGVRVRPSGDRAMSWLPFFHDMGLVGFMLAPLGSQTTTDYLATDDFARRPLTWLKLMSSNGGTISYAPSFGYELCARRVSTQSSLDLDLSRWRLAGIGGEMIKPAVMQQFAEAFRPYGFSDRAFCASYGLAECVLAVSFADAGTGMTIDRVDKRALSESHRAEPSTSETAGRLFVSCGKVIPEHQIEVRDPDGHALGERLVGRVYVRGPSVMQGYYNEPDATAEALTNGWLDTGDLGYWANGEIVIVGRGKDMLIINGRNIWPQDIEWSVEHIDGLRSGDSAAIVTVGADGSERPTVLVQCRASDATGRDQLAAAVRHRVRDAIGIDCDVVLIAPHSLPKTSSGKLARTRAKAMFEKGTIVPLAEASSASV